MAVGSDGCRLGCCIAIGSGMHNSSVSFFSYLAYFVQTLGTDAGYRSWKRHKPPSGETGQALPYIHVNDNELSKTKRTITLMSGLDM